MKELEYKGDGMEMYIFILRFSFFKTRQIIFGFSLEFPNYK